MAKKTTTTTPAIPKAKRTRKSSTQSPRDKLDGALERIASALGKYLVPKYASAGEPFATAVREAQAQVHAAAMLVRGFADDWGLATKTRGRAPLAVGDWVEPKDGALPFFGAEPRRVLEIEGVSVLLDCGELGKASVSRKLVKKIVRQSDEASA